MGVTNFKLRFIDGMKTKRITYQITAMASAEMTLAHIINNTLAFTAPEGSLWNLDLHILGKAEPISLRAIPKNELVTKLLGEHTPYAITVCSWHVAVAALCNVRIAELTQATHATFNARGGGKSNFSDIDQHFREQILRKQAGLQKLVAKRRMQATNPPDNLAQPNEQLRSQSTKEGNTAMSQVNHSVPVQTLTFVFGQRIDTMGKTELFTAAQAVAAQIAGLEKSNDAVGSVAIAQEIAGLKKDLAEIRRLLDTQFAKADEAVTGVAAAE